MMEKVELFDGCRVWYVGPCGVAGREVILEVGGFFYVSHNYGTKAEHVTIADLDGSKHPLSRSLVRHLLRFRKEACGVPFVSMFQGIAGGGSLRLTHEEMKFVAQLLTWICKDEIEDAAGKDFLPGAAA